MLPTERISYSEFATKLEQLATQKINDDIDTPGNINTTHKCSIWDLFSKLTQESSSKHPGWTDFQKRSSMTSREFLRYIDYFKDNYDGDDKQVRAFCDSLRKGGLNPEWYRNENRFNLRDIGTLILKSQSVDGSENPKYIGGKIIDAINQLR